MDNESLLTYSRIGAVDQRQLVYLVKIYAHRLLLYIQLKSSGVSIFNEMF
jgi:hypothetical protein